MRGKEPFFLKQMTAITLEKKRTIGEKVLVKSLLKVENIGG